MLLLAALAMTQAAFDDVALVRRDDYGVAHIAGKSEADAWRATGFAVAQDRMWQMELSRHRSRGRLAEILGQPAVASDKEVRLTGYTDAELQAQIDALPASLQQAMTSYSEGVNDFFAKGQLPAEYAKYDLKPESWTPLDSAAIAISLLQYFGRGGAGAIRNMAALGYLQGQKAIKGKVLDVIDDVLWQNDPSSPTTIAKEDETSSHIAFVPPTRAVSERHLAMLPKLGLFDLLPGLSLASREASTRLAERMALPFHTGSYCMVANSKRSATGAPILLSGPQMGFTIPSIVHEMSINTPSLSVVGADLPGVPAVLIGHTANLAWGLTSGVADTDDIVFAPKVGSDSYKYGTETRKLETHDFVIHVKGGADVPVTQTRTADSVVVLNTAAHGDTPGYVFGRKSSYRGRELTSLLCMEGIWKAKNVHEADQAASLAPMSFNAFYADVEGHIGYRFCGLIPNRTTELDPRFPIPDDPQYAWKGFVKPEDMPHVFDPKSGLITNWNNKPVSWWPNLDTPVWGRIFRVTAIRANLTEPELSSQDLELAAWKIARTDETWPYFAPYVERAAAELKAEQEIGGFQGLLMQGSRQAVVYRSFLTQLRKELFLGSLGNFLNEDLFTQALQPSLMLQALEGKTKVNYLAGRKADEVVKKALLTAVQAEAASGDATVYEPGKIQVADETPVPYSNRGSYIQVIELLPTGPRGRNVLPPGVAATGPHSKDQVPLARAWTYKPMSRP